jgi:hypothetical protein
MRKGRALALRSLILAGLLAAVLGSPMAAGELVVQPIETMETKALFGRSKAALWCPPAAGSAAR